MATATTITSWLEELALSITPSTRSLRSPVVYRAKDNFVRRVKNHPYGRTDQFAVKEKLIGLEEKFQVLNLDNVAAELFSSRVELDEEYGELKWLPDILDLLLHLSHNPVHFNKVDDIAHVKQHDPAVPILTWADIEKDDPLDRADLTWKVPRYEDYSSDEDERLDLETTQTSPTSVRDAEDGYLDEDRIFDTSKTESGTQDLPNNQIWHSSGKSTALTEIQVIREVLFMLQGLPTSVFEREAGKIHANSQYRFQNLAADISASLLRAATELGTEVNRVRQWLSRPQEAALMQLIHSKIRDILQEFDHQIDHEQTTIVRKAAPAGVVTLVQVTTRLKRKSAQLMAVTGLITLSTSDSAVVTLNALYEKLTIAEECCNQVELETLSRILLPALNLCSKSYDIWLHTGVVNTATLPFQMQKNEGSSLSTLWHDWFAITDDHYDTVPTFLKDSIVKIFTIGKTAAFLRQLGSPSTDENLGVSAAVSEATRLLARSSLPFPATFELVLGRHLQSLLASSTGKLQHVLDTQCGLNNLLDAFGYIFLAKDGTVLANIESKMFDSMDNCLDTWNDRFLLADSMAEAYAQIRCIDADSIMVQSTYTSSRSMESRRRSVKILAAVSTSYHVSWPLANIIPDGCLISYQRIALVLCQIRRAKYLLERRAYPVLRTMPHSVMDEFHQRRARLLHSQLRLFIDRLYAHLTQCTIRSFTTLMRAQLRASSTTSLDDMISVHQQYITSLEHACLSSRRLKLLREALITILDLSIHFTDLIVALLAKSEFDLGNRSKGDKDFEASSFQSAQSRRKRRKRRDEDDSESSDDEHGYQGYSEGYSTFILDEDSSFTHEMSKISTDFKKNFNFLVAGLRAVARSTMASMSQDGPGDDFDVGGGFELLADSLGAVFAQKPPD